MGSATSNPARFQIRPLVVPLLISLAAVFAGLVLVLMWIEMPFGDLSVLVAYLLLSSLGSSAIGFVAYRLSEAGRRSIQTKVLLAHGLGALIVIANIFVTAKLMFISTHDLGLLMLLLVFCALFSVTFGAGVANRMTSAVERLADGAREVARGNFTTRVDVQTNDELADLASSFNDMVARVNEAAEARKRADAARRELVAAVSHDLRTPLTAIRAMLEALSDGVVDDPQTVSRFHSTMRVQVEHLSRLIDDLFELSQLEAGGEHYDLRPTDVSGIVADTVEGFAMTAARRHVSLELRSTGSAYARVESNRIARVLHNLLDNALRHSHDGGNIAVSLVSTGPEVIVSVRDHGDGVEPGDLPYVFDRFYRGEKSRSRSFGGAGLGLAIAHGIITGHGGRISVENHADGGAVFTFGLPACAPPRGS